MRCSGLTKKGYDQYILKTIVTHPAAHFPAQIKMPIQTKPLIKKKRKPKTPTLLNQVFIFDDIACVNDVMRKRCNNYGQRLGLNYANIKWFHWCMIGRFNAH